MKKQARIAYLAVFVAATSSELCATAPHSAYRATDPLAMIRHQSPGPRTVGALPNKVRAKRVAAHRIVRVAAAHVVKRQVRPAKVATRRPKPVSAVLPTAVENQTPIGVTSSVLAEAGSPVPATALAPALGSSSAVFAGGGAIAGGSALPFLAAFPAAFAIGSSGGGGGASSASFAPAAPEPGTWLMMIFGFGFLGSTMRKRRRALRKVDTAIFEKTLNAPSTT
jgi:hypothetical protein